MSSNNSTRRNNLLEVNNVSVTYSSRKYLFFKQKQHILTDINFTLNREQTLVITGDAGSGKTTLLKLLTNPYINHSGEIMVHGKPLSHFSRRNRVHFIRMLPTDHSSAVNPHKKVNFILEQPLRMNSDYSAIQREYRIDRILELVGLSSNIKSLYPGFLTSNQLLRLSIAKTLITEPEILLVDANIEKLDAQLRSHCLNLFMDQQKEHGMALIICLNDFGLIKHIADKILILSQGRQEDYGNAKFIISQPQKDITKRLIQDYNNEYRIRPGI